MHHFAKTGSGQTYVKLQKKGRFFLRINVDTDNGFSHCAHDASKYAKHAGDANYNILK